MGDSLPFDADLYPREALELAASKLERRARVELSEDGARVVVRLQPLDREGDAQPLWDAFCNEAFSATIQALRKGPGDERTPPARPAPESDAPPWALLAPFGPGSTLDLGWVLDSLSPVRGGAATLTLRHERDGAARVAVRRNTGSPRGVAHTDHLDFLLMNSGGGVAQTDTTIERVLVAFAGNLSRRVGAPPEDLLAALLPVGDAPDNRGAAAGAAPAKRLTPRIDTEHGTVSFDLDEADAGGVALYDKAIAFAERCSVFLERTSPGRIALRLRATSDGSADTLRLLARDVTKALNHAAHHSGGPPAATPGPGAGASERARTLDLDALLAELDAADPATLGVGFQPDRGPEHPGMRVLNILGTGACDSDCLFCCEKYSIGNRFQPNTDTTRQLIVDAAHQYDMLFFASGEPTIHPNLFAHVELAKGLGFTAFGMSSHFRRLRDPHFTLKLLQAGFRYFDISLHAADAAGQLEINPIEDGGASLFEALKGLAVLFRLAHVLGIPVSVTHKIVVSRLNVKNIEAIFRATYDRGVRHFIVQPARAVGLASDRIEMLHITEEEILPYLNEFLRKTAGLGVVVKPYGFSRRQLVSSEHVEHEQNRVKNISGKLARERGDMPLPRTEEAPGTNGRHRVEVRSASDERFAFSAAGDGVVLDEALQRGATLPFGCRMGSCGMCCARLLDGRVDQSTQIFLTDDQMAQGYVLLCQARPLSDVTVRMCSEEEIDAL